MSMNAVMLATNMRRVSTSSICYRRTGYYNSGVVSKRTVGGVEMVP